MMIDIKEATKIVYWDEIKKTHPNTYKLLKDNNVDMFVNVTHYGGVDVRIKFELIDVFYGVTINHIESRYKNIIENKQRIE